MDVGVSAAGLVKVDRHYSKSLYDLAGEAVDDALRDSGRNSIDYLVVSTVVSRALTPQLDIASYMASHLGLRRARVLSVEAGEASGLAALQAAFHLALGGNRVLVVGVDKLSDAPSHRVYRVLKHVYYRYSDGFHAIGHAAVAGLLARMYMERYGVSREVLAAWPVQMHMHAKSNPYAMLRFAVKPESVLKAMPVAEPLTLLDSFPLGDGAAALLVEPDGGMAGISAVESAVGPLSVAVADDPLRLEAVGEAWRRAAGDGAVVDVFEVHDSYTIFGLLILEELGLAERGKAAERVAEGDFTTGGSGPLVNPSGGLKARGHPVGATGVYMAAEVAMQLSGTFPGISVPEAKRGAAVSINGHGSSAYVALFTRRG